MVEYLKLNSEIIGYQLESCSIFRKYLSIFDVIFWFFFEINNENNITLFSSSILNGYNSMSFYKSQFIWFRKLFMIFSKYSFINTLEKIKN